MEATTSEMTEQVQPSPVDEPAPASRRGVDGGVLLVAACLAALTLFLASLHAFVPNSDSATAVLKGQAMLHGNVLLRGWSLSLDSFWTLDVPFNALALALHAPGEWTLHVVPSLFAVLVVVIGMVLARDGRRGWAPWVGSALVFALLGLPTSFLAAWFTQGELHISTALYCLVAFAGLRSGRFGAWWVVSVIFLAAGLLGDLEILAWGICPVVAAGVVAILRCRSLRAGAAPLTAAASSIVVAWAGRHVADALGAFTIGGTNPVAGGHQFFANFLHAVHLGLEMVGAWPSAFPGGVARWLEWFRLLGAGAVILGGAAALAGLVAGAIRGHAPDREGSWRLDDLLIVAALADVVVYALLAVTDTVAYARYLTPSFIFAVILAGRLATRVAARVSRPRPARVFQAGVLAVAAIFAAGFVLSVRSAPLSQPAEELAQFLESHNLHRGIGAYWASSITTVVSHGHVVIRPVIAATPGHFVPYGNGTDAAWYQHSFRFLVYIPLQPWGGINDATARAAFGTPSRVLSVDGYRILVWAHPITVTTTG